MLILHNQENGSSFHFLVSSLISFFKVSKFLQYRSFTCLVSYTPSYFMLFVEILDGDVSLILISSCLSSVYSRATDIVSVNLVSCNTAEGVYQV